MQAGSRTRAGIARFGVFEIDLWGELRPQGRLVSEQRLPSRVVQ